jgi:hypothetical protein
MAETSLEERLSTVEQEIARLKQRLDDQQPSASMPWWKKIVGVYKDDPEFLEAMRLGREYRESLRPPDYQDAG